MAEGRVADFSLTVGENRQVQARFNDMGDTFTCRATSSQPNFADVTNVAATSDPMGCELTVNAEAAGTATITVTADDGEAEPVSQSFEVTVNAPPAADSGGGSGGLAVLAIAAAGGYYWWKKRQIASGNAAAMALLPDVSFDLDRRDERAFFTKMNWANSGGSNWQIRSNLALHTKYSGELLDWNANSHIGYRLKGKFGEFNPYIRGKFVQNAPENAEMRKTYSFGLSYQMPNRFAIQLAQPNSELENYSLGLQWRGKSKIRYSLHGETESNAYRFTGSYAF